MKRNPLRRKSKYKKPGIVTQSYPIYNRSISLLVFFAETSFPFTSLSVRTLLSIHVFKSNPAGCRLASQAKEGVIIGIKIFMCIAVTRPDRYPIDASFI